ncbi:phosphoribosylanthranilate isomerase [Flavobacterium noncentrifugens]|uniref:N-(5'-phosphoribosyl)anthranilate isomerase n=1 Tax=Flavobacterium noncentrifugens TaxID=1128970 RepID=A0A1G8W562_9FLAO|nr:phosphoribosylanthranilate isomerase [Flavobacterium noncentrifugens]SDJ73432.1 phosphoribosylanthranilate isomerase [Flavobacterium noncentrifugens]
MKLKICGMKYPENIAEASELLPDFMGFIFWEKSVRYFDGDIPKLPESIQKVGVFVNERIEIVIDKIQKYQLQIVQLHGNESTEYCSELQKQNIKIIKVFSIENDFNFEDLKPFEAVANYFLFDTKGKLPGGNGSKFNWQILKNYNSEKPFFLSGGIGVNEIEEIKNLNLPIYAIDINSKFETEPGLKNIGSIKQFKAKL